MSLFPRLGCDNIVSCAQNACLNSFGIKAFTWIRLINSFHMYLLCYADDPVSGERSLPRGSWKTTGLNCWNNGLWILGKENNICSGASQQLEEEPRNFHPRDTQSPAGQATWRPIKVGSTFRGQQTTWPPQVPPTWLVLCLFYMRCWKEWPYTSVWRGTVQAHGLLHSGRRGIPWEAYECRFACYCYEILTSALYGWQPYLKLPSPNWFDN